MKIKKFIKCFSGALLAGSLIFSGCNFSTNNSDEENSGNTGGSSGSSSSSTETSSSVTSEITSFNSATAIDITSWANSYSPNTSSRNIITDADAYESVSFDGTVYINLSTLQISADNSTWTSLTDGGEAGTVTLGETEISASLSDGLLSVDSSSYKSNLKFDITGTAEKGAINISSYKKGIIALYLHNAVITSSGNYPAINVDAKSTVYLALEGENSLTDGRSYGTGYSSAEGTDYYSSSFTGTAEEGAEVTANWAKGADTKGSVYTKGPLLICGANGTTSGSLTVNEGYKHGIYSKDYIRIFGGKITVNSSGRNAIQSVNGFVMDDGEITISGTGTNTNNESRGIIVEGAEDNPGEGFIVINGGTITSTTVSKGISAKWDYDDDPETTETTDDPYPYVLIKGGKINITTTGTPADESTTAYTFTDADGVTVSETTKLSPEGIEGKQAVFISGGILNLNCTDDCINASRDTSGYTSQIVISGGNIYAYSSNNDAIDSNGNLTISGGVIVALTATTPECAFDCDSNTFAITGGLVAGIGTSNYSSPTASACSQSTVVLSGNYFGSSSSSGTSASTFAIEDSDGGAIFAFDLPSAFASANQNYVMILSSPKIATGTTYKTVSGATASGGSTFNNLYVELPSLSGGSETVTDIQTTSSSYVYTKISGTNGGAQEGSHPNMGPGGR